MRCTLLICQNTEAWNGLSQEIAAHWPDAQRWDMEIHALMHSGGEED
jgi:hypothetical protein